MADPGPGYQPASIPPHPPVGVLPQQPVVPSRKARSGCLTAFLIVLFVGVVCVAAGGVGVWDWWNHGSSDNGSVGQCFPAGPDGPLDTSHSTVSCSHPNAIWQITKVIDGLHNGDVIGTCGPDGDALIYIADEDQSYCLDYIN